MVRVKRNDAYKSGTVFHRGMKKRWNCTQQISISATVLKPLLLSLYAAQNSLHLLVLFSHVTNTWASQMLGSNMA